MNAGVLTDTYVFGALLGKGSSGDVYEAAPKSSCDNESPPTDFPYAVKVIPYSVPGRKDDDEKMKNKNLLNDRTAIANELAIMQHLQCDTTYVVRLVEVHETADTLYIVMERARGGDLLSTIAALPTLSEALVKDLFRQLLEAVQYLHRMGIAHRDLKLSNILCDHNLDTLAEGEEPRLQVKLADFGISCHLDSPTAVVKTVIGTRPYLAPEVYHHASGFAADLWALGCVFVELVTGQVAFSQRETPLTSLEALFNANNNVYNSNLAQTRTKRRRSFEKLPGWDDEVHPLAKHLIEGLLNWDASKRLTAAQALRHPFVHTPKHGAAPSKATNSSTAWWKFWEWRNRCRQIACCDDATAVQTVDARRVEAPRPARLLTTAHCNLQRRYYNRLRKLQQQASYPNSPSVQVRRKSSITTAVAATTASGAGSPSPLEHTAAA
eukprot:gene10681-7605_t